MGEIPYHVVGDALTPSVPRAASQGRSGVSHHDVSIKIKVIAVLPRSVADAALARAIADVALALTGTYIRNTDPATAADGAHAPTGTMRTGPRRLVSRAHATRTGRTSRTIAGCGRGHHRPGVRLVDVVALMCLVVLILLALLGALVEQVDIHLRGGRNAWNLRRSVQMHKAPKEEQEGKGFHHLFHTRRFFSSLPLFSTPQK